MNLILNKILSPRRGRRPLGVLKIKDGIFEDGGLLTKMADRVWCLPLDFGHSKQLSLNKFFDPSTPFMRKGGDGGEKKSFSYHTQLQLKLS